MAGEPARDGLGVPPAAPPGPRAAAAAVAAAPCAPPRRIEVGLAPGCAASDGFDWRSRYAWMKARREKLRAEGARVSDCGQVEAAEEGERDARRSPRPRHALVADLHELLVLLALALMALLAVVAVVAVARAAEALALGRAQRRRAQHRVGDARRLDRGRQAQGRHGAVLQARDSASGLRSEEGKRARTHEDDGLDLERLLLGPPDDVLPALDERLVLDPATLDREVGP